MRGRYSYWKERLKDAKRSGNSDKEGQASNNLRKIEGIFDSMNVRY
jgi:hypothetical protein